MSKYTGPRLRIIRRLGEITSLTRKVPKRRTRPGQHGIRRIKMTQYAYRLAEKQKLRFYYGVSEKQLITYIEKARKSNRPTGNKLLQQLEMRLDNIVYRLGWAPTLPAARQLVNHGHILVDNHRVTIPSFSCLPNQNIMRRGKHRHVRTQQKTESRALPTHLTLTRDTITATITQWVDCNTIPLRLKELLVIEYYSNRLSSDEILHVFS